MTGGGDDDRDPMDAFLTFSGACLNRMVDRIGAAKTDAERRRYNDLYLHLIKMQRMAVDSGLDAGLVQRFRDEWATCEPAISAGGGSEWGDDSGGGEDGPGEEEPTPERLEEFKKTVEAWFRLDDEERELRRKAAERRMLKANLTSSITAFMERYGFEDLKTRGGTLRFFRREAKRVPAKSVQLERIKSFFGEGQADVADSLRDAVFREVTVETSGIRRLKR